MLIFGRLAVKATLQVPGQSPAVDSQYSFAPYTPSLANSVWGAQQRAFYAHSPPTLKRTASQDSRISAAGVRTPSGFEHLDFGADYFKHGQSESKREPRSFEWEIWTEEDSEPQSPTPSHFPQNMMLLPREPQVYKRRLGPNEVSYYLGSRGEGPDDPLAGVNDMYVFFPFFSAWYSLSYFAMRDLGIFTLLSKHHLGWSPGIEF